MGVEPFLVASSLVGVLAQRLVRRLCPDCKKPHQPSDEEIAELGLTRAQFAQFQGTRPTIYQPVGCPACNQNGYRGRTGIYEFLWIEDDIRQLVLKNVDSATIKKRGVEKGMRTLLLDGARRIGMGDTSMAEVLSVTQEDI